MRTSTLSTRTLRGGGARLRRALTWLAALTLTFTFFTSGGYLPQAKAYEAATAAWTGPVTGATDTSTLATPSGVTVTATTTGFTDLTAGSTLGSRGWDATDYSPTTMLTGDSALSLQVNATPCSPTGIGTCTGLGTLTLSFSQPVRNPILHLAGLGAAVGNGTNQSDFHAVLDLTTAGLSLSQVGTNGVLAVSGNRITATNDSTGVSCLTNVLGSPWLNTAVTAACGSVQINGVVSSVSFSTGAIWVKNSAAAAATFLTTSSDAFVATVTLPQDFSDAPTSYNGSQAPAHIVSDVALGAMVDADRANDRNPTTAPWAAAVATGDDTSGTDDEDAFGTLPDAVAQPGATYSLTVPISGGSKTARLCGWLDFNRNGTFDAGEQQCASPAAGATSSTLTWTVPADVSIGATNARFRLGYTAAQVQTPTGRADSGEVEDYPVSILARPQIILTKTTIGASGGPFTYTLTNTSQAAGTVTTATAGATVQVDGDTATTGTQAYTATAVNTAVTITEAALAGWSVASATCTTASGTTVGSLSGAAYTIPSTAVVPGAVITCAYTNAKPGLTFTKSNGGVTDLDANGPDAGDTVTYSFLVTNTGQTSLSGIAISDPKVTGVTCPVTTLAVGGNVTCSATYTLTQADVTAGSVLNTASVSANPPSGAALTATSSSSVTIPANPKITLAKTAGTASGSTAGSTVLYTFVVTNTGNLPLTGVGVSDPKVGPVTCPVTTLAPGAATTCTKSYALTQADVNAGTVVNTATATGTPPTGAAVTATSSATINISRTATMTLAKTAGTPSGTTAGSTLAYSFLVTNTGNVTLTSITIVDAKVPSYTCPVTTLAPGTSTTCSATHTITQAEIDAGVVTNFATTSATPPAGMSAPSANSTTTTPLTRTPAIALDKQYSGMTGQTVGSTVSYSFVVSNTGNVTLAGIWLQDAKVTSTSCPTTTLAVGAAVTCTGTYTLTQADVDAGHVSNTANATGYGPNGAAVTGSDTVDTAVTPGPAISLTKTAGTPSGNTAGSTVTYTFVVRNTGNVTLTSVGVSDPKVGPVSCSPTTLLPGATVTCTKTYALTQADVNAGSVVNTATARGTSPTSAVVQATSSTTATITRTTSLSFDKQAGTPSGMTTGSTIPYSFVVQNTGNVTVTSLAVTDAKVGSVTCPATTLLPGASTTCTGSYTITQADADFGHVANTATVTATPPSGMTPPTGTDTTDTTITAAPAISLAKTAGAPSGMTAGSTILYTFVVTNTGNVTLTTVGVSDPKVGPVSCPVASLAPGSSTTCTKSYSLTQADVDAGVVNNTATATGTPLTGAAVTGTSTVSTMVTRSPAITLDKQAGTPSGTTAGSTILYTFVVTNTGNVTLTTVGVSDPKVGPVSCPVASLAPGSSTTCTKSYSLTQADVDAGVVNNTATATGTPPTGPAVTGTSTVSSPITRTPAITFDKQAGTPSGTAAGSTIVYSFVVTNSGNVTLTAVGVTDARVGAITCPVTSLAPGVSTNCTRTYTLTQADVDSGHVANTASATGTQLTGTPVTATDATDTTIAGTPAITLTKTAGTPTGMTAGSTIAYTFVVRNAGNVTLTTVGVSDPKVGPVSCPVVSLAPGASTTCTKSYALTQADVDSGVVNNTATATGTPLTGAAVTGTSTVSTLVTRSPAITLDKQASTPSGTTAGSTIEYTFVVTNTGNVTLTAVGVTDPKVGAITCPVTSLAPGASTSCSATYTVTQADVDSGHAANTATASGTSPTGAPMTATDSTDDDFTPAPAITLTKTAGTPTGMTAGSTMAYTFVVTNTGNVTLTSVGVSDPKVGPVTCPVASLAPGASTTCTKSYTLTQADVDSGVVNNTATATGTPPTGAAVTATSTVSTPITRTPAITFDKQAGTPSGTAAGSTLPYTFVVTNSGNVTLTAVGVTDPKVGAITCSPTTLAPGASATCTKTYTLTQADLDAGHVANTATATSTPPTGGPATATDSTDTTVAAAPAITLAKTAGTPTGTTAGSTITYTFLLQNSGNVTLSSVGVSDPTVGPVTCPVATLAPGATTTCTTTYTLTQGDIDAGTVTNTATATGTPPTGAAVTSLSSVTTPLAQTPAISLTKTAGTPTGMAAGSTILYTFVVTNTGNVTLTTVGVSDPKVGAVTCPLTTLAPGGSTTCAKAYTLTQADVNGGVVDNTATAAGTPPTGAAVTSTASATAAITRTPALTVDKQAGTPSGFVAGSTIAYTFIVTNSGNVTLTTVGVTDPKVGTITCLVSSLAPGASTTCSTTYAMTQADVDSGHVANTATASGRSPSASIVTATDSTDTPSLAGPAITLVKSAGAPTSMTSGATVSYTFVVKNTGNLTLSSVGVSDPKVGPVTCPVATLAPGATTTCTKPYTLNQADVDAGTVNNTATATGTPPTGAAVTATSSVTTPITRTPSVAVDKQAGTPSGNVVGSTLPYTFVVTNTGNVTLTSVDVTDSKVGTVTCPVATLAPNDTTTCTATYTLTLADVDSGHVANNAGVSANPPTGPPVTGSDSTDTAITSAPALTLDKVAGTPSGDTAGSTIAYSFIITNTGNVTLSSIGVADPVVGTVTCPVTTLAPEATTTCRTTYTVSQADVDAGHRANTATASSNPPSGAAVTATDSTDTSIAASPSMTLDKEAAAPSGNSAGSTLRYTFVVTNTGNVTLTSVAVADPMVGTVSCPVTFLAPGAYTSCSATYTLTQADVDAGHVANTATAAATAPSGDVVGGTDSTDTPITATPKITLDKQAGVPSAMSAGATLPFTFVVTNTGNVTLTSVAVTDAKVATVACPVASLAPGASTSCAATYTVTQADVDSGHVANSAAVGATPPLGAEVSATDTTDTAIVSTPSITLDKVAGVPSANAAGATLPYTFVATNTGNVTVHLLTVIDPKIGTVSCPLTTLLPGQSTTCTATYVLAQADVDAGHVANSALVTANPPSGDPVTATDAIDTLVPAAPGMTLDKVASAPSGNTAGSTIAYSFVVKNTGNVTLATVSIADAKVGTISCPATSLAPGSDTTCTATYTLTQADVDAGHVANTASVSAMAPQGQPASATDSTDTAIASTPAVSLDKQAGTATGSTAGSTIAYTFAIANTGNVTLTAIAIADAKVGTVSCPVTALAPGAGTTCTASYTLLQTDIDAGHVANSATVSATPPSGPTVTATDSVDAPVASNPAITIDKQAGSPSGTNAGSTIGYTFQVSNTGNVTLTGIAVADPKISSVACPVISLTPGASTTCTATYTLTQADVDAGQVANTATVTGHPPTGTSVTATDSVTTPIAASPKVAIDKQAGAPSGTAAGATIPYTFVVTNTGNVTLTPITISDPVVGTVACPVTTLAPATSTTCTATYTTTQDDFDAGHRANTATVTAWPPTGAAVTSSDLTDTVLPVLVEIHLDKTAGIPSGTTAGSTVPYSFVVTNAGNITLTGIVINDPTAGTVTCLATELAPTESTTCTALRTLTQADVDAGHVANTATVTATEPDGGTISMTDTVDTLIPATPGVTLDKVAGLLSGTSAGATVPYTFVVTNTGNVTLASIVVTDPKVGGVSCPVLSLAPRSSTLCTATYTLTQADVDAGHVANLATVSANPPSGNAVNATDTTDTTVTARPSLSLDKHAAAPSGSVVGSTIAYTLIVTNTGNVTLTSVGVSDAVVGTVSCPVSTLSPGGHTTCTATYTLRQSDVDAGHVVNSATALGTPPVGDPVSGADATDTPIPATPSMTLDKQAGAASGTTAGSTIVYSFVVANTGNVTLASIAISDPKVGAVSCPVTALAPGATTRCTATYTLLQADVDAGQVANTATVSAAPPLGAPVTAADSTLSTIPSRPQMVFDKQASAPTGATVGSTITYSFHAENTGNVSVHLLGVIDPKLGAVNCPVTTLAPGENTTCVAVYTLTQTDVDAGHVPNDAALTATPPSGPPITVNDSTDSTVEAGASITLDKQAGTPTGATAGSTIAYSFVVRNSGNVTLTSVTINDLKVGTVSCPVTSLAPGSSTTCTASYTLLQSDVDAGHVANTATVSATPPTGIAVTGTDSTNTPITTSPSVTLDKQAGAPAAMTAGATLPYSFVVTNTGNVTVTSVAVSDPKVGAVVCPVTTLAPGAQTTCTASYTLLQSDVDAGHVDNTATVSATPPTGAPVTAVDSTDTTVTASPSVTLDKQAGLPSGNSVGSTISYTFVLTNSGNVTLHGASVSDPKVGTVNCPETTLAPTAQTVCTSTYTLTQADVDAGHVPNTATGSAIPPTGTPVTVTDSTDTTITAAPSMTLDKQAGTPTGNTAGSTISYTFLVTNTGNVTLSTVDVDDARVGTVVCPVTTLAPGAHTTCTASYTLLQSDADAGHVANTATVSATPPSGDPASATDSTDSTIPSTPSVAFHKQAGALSGTSAGSTLPYTFVVTNTGNVTLTGVVVNDPLLTSVSCVATTLAPGAQTTCSATYALTQADVDAGHIANTASVSATPPSGPAVGGADSTDTPIAAAPSVTLDKQVGTPTGNAAGDTIPYAFVVENTGNVTLYRLTITDPVVGTTTCPVTTLAPGAHTTCTATHPLTQADADNGHVANTASAAAQSPTGVVVSATDSTDVSIDPNASVSLDKQAGTPSGATIGATIPYSFVVTNTGTVTVTTLTISDGKVGTVSCPVTTLAPNAHTTCTATYTLTQADIDAGHVANTATVQASPTSGGNAYATDSTDTLIPAAPSVTVDKQAGTPTGAAAGATIDYSFVVTNTGNVTLTLIEITDAKTGLVTCPATTLAPGDQTTCTAAYTLKQTDVDAGHVANTATVAATPPAGDPVTASDTTDTVIPATGSITVDKVAGTLSGGTAGSTLPYTFVVTNTGNVTVTDVAISDPKVGMVVCPVTMLAPNAQTTCTATYTLAQSDVDAGHVANTATASALPPSGVPVTAADNTDTLVPALPDVTLDKQAGIPSGTSAGATITYAFVVTNTGNVTVTDAAVSDAKVGTVVCPVTTLDPGESTSCEATYTMTQADIDAGHVANTATASVMPPTGSPVNSTDSTDTLVSASPSLSFDKQAGTPSGSIVGATLPYSFVVTNTGNVTLSGIAVTDLTVGAVTCPATPVAPGTTTICTATYTLTQADVDAGHVANTASVSATPPTGAAVTGSDSTDAPIAAAPSVALDKQAGTLTGATVGSTLDYTFLVTNTGNVTLTDVTVADVTAGTVSCPVATLAPGAYTTCTVLYTLTQVDVDAGHVANTATVSATPPAGAMVYSTDATDTLIPAAPGLAFDKQAGSTSADAMGATLEYTFVVTNTGNVTLSALRISDPKVGAVACMVTTLAPTATATCTATYTLTQADVDSGHVANTATASATPPGGTAVTGSDSTDTTITPASSLTLEKQSGALSGATAGATVPYTFLVTNTGNVTVTGLAISDPKVGAVSCPATSLAPTEQTTCTATYTLAQADVDAGHVANTATASATQPSGDPVSVIDTIDTLVPANPSIALDKQAGTASGATAGSTVPYTFLVTNTGNVTVSSLTVADPIAGVVTCTTTSLAPGAQTMCTASHTLTQAEVDAGHLTNTAIATVTPQTGLPVSATDTVDTLIAASPSISLDKRAGTLSGATVGSTLPYSFVVTNTGNVTVSGTSVSDPKVGGVSCPVTTLAPNASTTCTATYTLTQADVDAGHVPNTATASATPPTGTAVTGTDSTDTLVPANPSVTVDKQAGALSGTAEGSTLPYTFVVTNTGNVTLTSIAIDDVLVGTVSCPATSLAPNAQLTCSATYTLTQADVDAGHRANAATVSATPPTGPDVTGADSADTTIAPSPGVSLVKQAGTPTGITAGSTIDYTLVVTNTGNVTLHGVTIDDPMVGAVSCPVTPLAPNAQTTCTATYALTQGDVDAGHVTNTATASALSPTGATTTSTDDVDTTIPAHQHVTLDKQAGAPTGATKGSTIAYTFVVTNNGNVTLHGVTIDDPMVGAVSCPVTPVAPSAQTTCTATYTLTQADVDAGQFTNSATASALSPAGVAATATDGTITTIPASPSVSLDKQAGAPTGASAGSTILYSFVVTNTGNVTVTNLDVADAMVGTVSCPVAPLAPDSAATCTATYTLTQADVDAGHVANTATVSATPPVGAPVASTDSTDATIPANALVTLDKQAGTPTGATAGSTIPYTFVVTNAGNVTLAVIQVDDPLVASVLCSATTLVPGAQTTCTATYTLTQADIDAGHLLNSAAVSATPPHGPIVVGTAYTDTVLPASPSVTLHKQAGTPSGSTAGSTILYSFVVTNTGNVTLDGVTVNDPMAGTVTCPVPTLAPNASTTCTATYAMTQAQVDAGIVFNSATVTATAPAGDPTTATDAVDVPIAAAPSLELDKRPGIPSGNVARATMSYSFVVTNTGNVTLTGVTVSDPKVGAVICPAEPVAPGAATTCTATYLLTQADVDAGHVLNTASATADPPIGPPVSGTDTVDSPVVAAPGITLDKQAGVPSGGTAGSTIEYVIVVTNTGNVTLDSVLVNDPLVGTVACPTATVLPHTSITCSALYTLTQGDVDSGMVSNLADVTAVAPVGDLVSASDHTDTIIASNPAITLHKTAAQPAVMVAGATITYSMLVTNTGNVTLDYITVTDPLTGPVSCPVGVLAPAESTTCTVDYLVTQADLDSGHIENTARAYGNPPFGDPVDADDDVSALGTVVTVLAQQPSLTIEKLAGSPKAPAADGALPYTFVVTNIGNVTLSDVVVSDPMVGTVLCPVTTLAPGATTTCIGTYHLSQADLDLGRVTNQATVTATPPLGDPVSADDTITTPLPQNPVLTFTKAADTPGPVGVGTQVRFTFVVTNVGNVTLTSITVTDPMLTGVSCPTATLAPGESVVCGADPYSVTATDAHRGSIVNTAAVEALGAEMTVTLTRTATVTIRTATLPNTGSPVEIGPLVASIVILGLGMVLTATGRRRRIRGEQLLADKPRRS
ncbi:MAG: beta strand repeat-containing protein [Propionibacteriaceae bacterium]